ncbi:DUF1674-domain-containing protein [Lentithecium fluviatile CBS 122367]|uniref:Succinate dehydrogenase assembly factor 4, mitochondrial n=1 Tax=Lentithecium fluviatile CBS 122367 TaxID=1168545 RepID=A0A6G1JFX9_9PLEO|nr:DUF1674-domain-containing protein [Lentithecium fluviatile CBS 122367]
MQQTLLRLPRHLSRRAIAVRNFRISTRHRASFGSGPAPPRLPKEEQELFEKLQQQSTGAFSTPRSEPTSSPTTKPDIRMRINQSPDSTPAPSSQMQAQAKRTDGVEVTIEGGSKIKEDEEFHPNMRRGAPPEFEGDVNPKTGEVGGPKNEPLRWGHGGDWSYNGRVTDF